MATTIAPNLNTPPALVCGPAAYQAAYNDAYDFIGGSLDELLSQRDRAAAIESIRQALTAAEFHFTRVCRTMAARFGGSLQDYLDGEQAAFTGTEDQIQFFPHAYPLAAAVCNGLAAKLTVLEAA
jgi:hypothetical protein